MEADGWLKVPGMPSHSPALESEEEEELSIGTDNRYAILGEDTPVEDPVKNAPVPLPQRTEQRHRRPPYVPPLSSSSEGSGVRQQSTAVHPSAQPGVRLSEGDSTTTPTKITPQPLSERTGTRHRTPSPMGPAGLNQCGSGVRGQIVEGTSSQDVRMCGTQQPKIPRAQRPPSGPVQRLKGADTTRVLDTKPHVSWEDTPVEDWTG